MRKHAKVQEITYEEMTRSPNSRPLVKHFLTRLGTLKTKNKKLGKQIEGRYHWLKGRTCKERW